MRRMLMVMFTMTSLAVCLATPAPAAERPVVAQPVGYGNGYNNVVGDKGAFQRIMRVGNDKIAVYALDFRRSVAMDSNALYSAVARKASSVSQIDRAAFIASRSSRTGTPLSDPNAEAAAVQVAIWMLTSSLDPAPVGAVNAPVRARAESLVSAATPIPGGDVEMSFGMTAKTTGSGGSQRLEIRVTTGARPAVAIPLAVNVAGTDLNVRTNDEGIAIVKLAGVRSGSAYRASFSWVLPAGSVLVPADGSPVVTATDATGSAQITGTVNSAKVTSTTKRATPPSPKATSSPVPTPSSTPSSSASPTPSTSGETDPAQLVIDFTGNEQPPVVESKVSSGHSQLPAVIAAVLLLGVAIIFARRRNRH